jgi:hypothetical protein
MRNFELTILDSDGEEYVYRVLARDAYTVARKARVIATRYGHVTKHAVNVHVTELVSDTDMTNAIEVR